MSESIHPLVLATIENERARRELELERLRSAREACVTATTGGQNRALALGKKIRELEKIVGSWRLVLATVLDADDSDPYDTGVGPELRASYAAMVERTCGVPDPASTQEGFQGLMGEAMDLTGPKLETGPLPVVGSKSPRLGKLRCVACTTAHKERFGDTGRLVDVTSEDLPDGGVCVSCHGDVLA